MDGFQGLASLFNFVIISFAVSPSPLVAVRGVDIVQVIWLQIFDDPYIFWNVKIKYIGSDVCSGDHIGQMNYQGFTNSSFEHGPSQ